MLSYSRTEVLNRRHKKRLNDFPVTAPSNLCNTEYSQRKRSCGSKLDSLPHLFFVFSFYDSFKKKITFLVLVYFKQFQQQRKKKGKMTVKCVDLSNLFKIIISKYIYNFFLKNKEKRKCHYFICTIIALNNRHICTFKQYTKMTHWIHYILLLSKSLSICLNDRGGFKYLLFHCYFVINFFFYIFAIIWLLTS